MKNVGLSLAAAAEHGGGQIHDENVRRAIASQALPHEGQGRPHNPVISVYKSTGVSV